jgi:NADH:ubiquinone oxidoreductase subunit F (NADH-binding)
LAGESAATLKPTPSPLPPANPSGNEEALFSNIRKQGHNTLEVYQDNGGFKALESSLKEGPIHVIEVVTKSKLAGRGGA